MYQLCVRYVAAKFCQVSMYAYKIRHVLFSQKTALVHVCIAYIAPFYFLNKEV